MVTYAFTWLSAQDIPTLFFYSVSISHRWNLLKCRKIEKGVEIFHAIDAFQPVLEKKILRNSFL